MARGSHGYLPGFIVDDGKLTIIQQGMNTTKQARRYHWLSEGLTSFIDAPMLLLRGIVKALLSTSPISRSIISLQANWTFENIFT